MRFQFTATVKPGNDLEKIDVTFSAPTWGDASEWANIFVRQVGLKVSDLDAGWTITPAARVKAPAPVVIAHDDPIDDFNNVASRHHY